MHANPVPLQNLAAFCTILITGVQSLNRWLCHPVICVLQVTHSNFRSCSMYKSHSLSTLAMKYLYACCVVPRGSWHFHPGLWMGVGRLYAVKGSAKATSSQSAAYHLTTCCQSRCILSKRFMSSSISSGRQQQGSWHLSRGVLACQSVPCKERGTCSNLL